MPLRLRELLSDPSLGLALAAGSRGLDERGPVRWAHISEIPDPTPWLEGGEILLTTGLGVRDSEALQRRLVAGLDDRGCPGVGFGLGVVLDAVPPAMLDEAERRRLPLFTVPYEVPFIAVTKRVSRHVFEEHYATLRRAVDLHRSVLSAVLSGAGVRSVLDTVAHQMPGFGTVLFDYYGQVLARRATASAALPDWQTLWALIGGPRQPRDRFSVEAGDTVVTAAVIRLGEQVEGILALVGDHVPADHELLLLEQAVTGVSLELARGVSVREAHRARVDDLLDEVAHNRIGHRALQRQLTRLGAEPERPYRVLCLRTEQPGVSLRTLSDLVEDALAATGSAPVVGRHEGDVFCLTQPPDGVHAERVAAALKARGWSRVAVGRSRPKDDLEVLDAALREAAAATRAVAPGANGAVGDVAQLGLTGMLAGLDAALVDEAFVAPVLGPLLDYDRREGARLVASLRAYLAHGCRPGPAAAELGVHRHTLTYRLDRIATLTERDLRDGRHLLEFGLALELHDRRP